MPLLKRPFQPLPFFLHVRILGFFFAFPGLALRTGLATTLLALYDHLVAALGLLGLFLTSGALGLRFLSQASLAGFRLGSLSLLNFLRLGSALYRHLDIYPAYTHFGPPRPIPPV